MVLIHAYTTFHRYQLDYFLDRYHKQKVIVLTPEIFIGRIKIKNKSLHKVVGYSGFDPASFFSVYFGRDVGLKIKELELSEVNTVIVPDLTYTLNNYLVSATLSQNRFAIVNLYLDGILSFVDSKVTRLDTLKDYVKRTITYLMNPTYIVRGENKTGIDLSLCKIQYSNLNIGATKYKKTEVYKDLVRFPYNFSAGQKKVVFVSQDATCIMPEYESLFCETIGFIEQQYPEHEICVIKRHHEHSLGVKGYKTIARLHKCESAESVISRVSPDVVISHTSTVIFNLAVSNYNGNIISFQPDIFNKLAKNSADDTSRLVELFRELNIKIEKKD